VKKKAILQGVFVDYLGVVLMVLAGFIAVPYYFDYISKEEYGLWLAINSVVTMVALVDLATDQFLMTVTSNDQKFYSEEYADYLTSILVVKGISAVVVAGVSSVIFAFLDSLVNVGAGFLHSAQLTFSLGIVVLVLGIFINSMSALLYARHHYSFVNACTSLFSIASTVGTIILLKENFGIVAFPIALIISIILQGIVFSIILMRRFPHLRVRLKNFKFHGKSEILGYATNFQALRWLYTFRAQYIAIAINNLAGSASLAQYMLTSRLTQLGPTFASKLAQAFFPSIADLFEKGDMGKIADIFVRVSKVLARVAILAGIIFGTLNESFVALWVGEDKYAGDGTLICIVIMMMLYIAMALFPIVIFASKKFERWAYWGIAEIAMAIALSYYLSLRYGLLGVVMGFALAYLPTQIYLFHIVLGQLKLGTLKFIQDLGRYAVRPNVIPFVVACTVILTHIEVASWPALLGLASSLLILHFTFEAARALKSKEHGIKNKIADVLKV
jgi:O-antigen/teichoic acid export membrane protein